MGALDKLFGSAHFVKVLRLFVLNPGGVFDNKEIARRTKIKAHALRNHLNDLKGINLINKRNFPVGESSKIGGRKGKKRISKAVGWQLNPNFELLEPLKNLLLNTEPFRDSEIIRRFKNAGRLKLVAVAGVFTHDPDSRVDILIVGDNLRRGIIENTLRGMEAEIGRELEYAVLDTKDFSYRMEVYDKFIRDILDFPHRKILDKLGI